MLVLQEEALNRVHQRKNISPTPAGPGEQPLAEYSARRSDREHKAALKIQRHTLLFEGGGTQDGLDFIF
jgi:hypothetical protein